MKKVLLCTMLIVGTTMGAGFCSGKEMVVYFAKFGPTSLYFVPVLFLLYVIIFRVFLLLGRQRHFESVQSINQTFFGTHNGLYNKILFGIYVVFSAAMFAGLQQIGQLIGEGFGVVFLLFAFVFCYLVLLKPFQILAKLNTVIVPILMVLLTANCIIGLLQPPLLEQNVIYPSSILLLFNPLLYACQGVTLAYFVLLRAGEHLTKKQIGLSAFFSAFLLCFGQTISMLVFWRHPTLLFQSMPLVSLAFMIGSPMNFFYLLALFLAIITTLFSTTRALNEFVQIKINGKHKSALLSLCLPLLLSFFGFDKIVEYLYPLIGVVGFLMLMFLSKNLFFKQRFKFVNGKIHHASKNAKQSGGSHHKVDVKHLPTINN